ncbi:TIGR02680 family protein [Gordonia sp. HY002]|uniref:TIGR02680 family protein n=1 Tax=Gordonia zhenghanii TaxID=2911516 RepID=UPI001EF1175F|nr:TIGR02680 family protein [Gordonia zhenghanii]MCF8571238.1 TIGR02680 family protein [Gordonia zhenghanii]MCF8601762.1 TIGR02680 family protein [Gordonia zhenghanii]
MTDSPGLPTPTTRRWTPLRLGLVDLFYYDDEQFWFHDGRLLLRGNNGTGKSKVLALTLPFLLDGSTRAHRVEPDADPKKTMEWNLLLAGTHPNSERTGYSWAEFGRVDDDGRPCYTTIGIGLKAATGRGIVKSWFFVSDRRVGDLRLLDEQRIVVTQERLRDELETTGAGQVYTTQEQYRRAVDEAMFGLGPERYGALIDLLIQLRQPQLSKRPDEKALSAALTEALGPPDQALVADVAESFRSLDEEREGVAAATETLHAAQAFLRHYRMYAQVAVRRHTSAVRQANSGFEWAGRDLSAAQEQLGESMAREETLALAHEQTREQMHVLEGQDKALRSGPQMRDADRLDQLSGDAAAAEGRAVDAEAEAVRAADRARVDADGETAEADRHATAVDALGRYETRAVAVSAQAGLAADHPDIAYDQAAAERALKRRSEQIRHVRALVADQTEHLQQAESARRALDAAEGDETGRAEGLVGARDAVDEAVDGYRSAVRAYLSGLDAIVLPDNVVDRAQAWARTMSGASPVRAATDEAAAAVSADIHREIADAETVASTASRERDEITARIAEHESGRDVEPARPPGRDPDARRDRRGAPLWRLVGFTRGISDAEQAAAEAALESAGLLDAWVFPDGTVQAGGDVVLGPIGGEVVPALADILEPETEPESGVEPSVIRAVLGRIGWGEESDAALWVDGDGRWGAGPARGQWRKSRVEFVGAMAREQRRRSVIAELQEQVVDLDAILNAAGERIAAATRRMDQVDAERDAYPAVREHELSAVHERVAAAERELAGARATAAYAREHCEHVTAEVERTGAELAGQAADLDLSTRPADLDVTDAAVTEYAVLLSQVRSAAEAVSDAAVRREDAARRAAESADLARGRDEERGRLRADAAGLRSRYDELHATVGASVAELQERLAAVKAAIDTQADEQDRIERLRRDEAAATGTLRQRVADLTERREEAASARARTISALREFTMTGLLRVAAPEVTHPSPDAVDEWTLTAAVSLARTAEQQLSSVDESDEAWNRSQQRISGAWTELTTQMSKLGHQASLETRGDVMLARVRYLHDEVDVDVLTKQLTADVESRERILSARERAILENSLVNEAAAHLHDLLSTADEQIEGMNRELAARRTSTGMQLRVRWRERADGPAGLAAARAVLSRSDATWTQEDRAAVGEFLQSRIGEIREADPEGGWQRHLQQALDYRQWHVFAIDRYQNGQWRSASGPASGGERALAVSIPLFAAASAHYNSAAPTAPRLILLDEAFAGVDDDSRAKSLGLLATFDLDVVMTSEREWGCYPQVPGLAIAQLSRMDGVDAVGVTRWRWDGTTRERDVDVPLVATARGTSTGDPDTDQDTLFG